MKKLLWLGFTGSCLSLICDFLLGWMVYPEAGNHYIAMIASCGSLSWARLGLSAAFGAVGIPMQYFGFKAISEIIGRNTRCALGNTDAFQLYTALKSVASDRCDAGRQDHLFYGCVTLESIITDHCNRFSLHGFWDLNHRLIILVSGNTYASVLNGKLETSYSRRFRGCFAVWLRKAFAPRYKGYQRGSKRL